MSYELPPFDESARCRKCQYDAIQTEWQGSLHTGCSVSRLFDLMPFSYLGKDPETHTKQMDEWRSRAAELPDHLERRCSRCGYRWAEALAVPA